MPIQNEAGTAKITMKGNHIAIRKKRTVAPDSQPLFRMTKPITQPGKPPATDLFNSGVYLRGALTLHALRKQVGDDAFFRILQTYTSRYQYGNASTADFRAVAEAVSGQDLAPLFQAWLYDPALPALP